MGVLLGTVDCCHSNSTLQLTVFCSASSLSYAEGISIVYESWIIWWGHMSTFCPLDFNRKHRLKTGTQVRTLIRKYTRPNTSACTAHVSSLWENSLQTCHTCCRGDWSCDMRDSSATDIPQKDLPFFTHGGLLCAGEKSAVSKWVPWWYSVQSLFKNINHICVLSQHTCTVSF